ncbi:MAG: tryptophan synthase subunit alpha [Hyphomonadaceae bacterium]
MSARLSARFAQLKREGRAGLVAYVMADDPNPDIAFEILRALPKAGADVIELGFPFTDPMADGPSIQRAGQRALKSGGSLKRTLSLLARFRKEDRETPVVLMGYANPIERMGYADFAAAAHQAGADGLIAVDIPPEEDRPLRAALGSNEIALIRFATPTTDESRLTTILDGASGFLYYVSLTGVTGVKAIGAESARSAVKKIKKHTDLPVAVGFGVRDAAAAAAIAADADAVVIGSAFVDEIARCVEEERMSDAPAAVAAKVRVLSEAVRNARQLEKA